LGEEAARRWAHRVPITIVRPSGVFGPWDKNMFEVFRAVIRFGVYAVPVWPTLGVCVIYIADLIHVLLLAAERGERLVPLGRENLPPGHGVYFAASAEGQRAAEVGRMIARAAGRRRVLILPVPSPLVWMTAAGGEMMGRLFRCPPPVSWDRAREGTAGLWHCCCRSAVEQLGFSEPAPLIERFRQTADWYREHGWL
jgi:nucleoside-diphosphate-sugar epimerase